MKQVFDVALIGAGPTACAALGALIGSNVSVAVVTGASPETRLAAHPKIKSVCYESHRDPGLADMTQAGGNTPALFASAEVGGLANYWGQQLQILGPDDPWGKGPALPTWEGYRAHCKEVTRDLKVIGGAALGIVEMGGTPLEIQTPRLLVGTRTLPEAQLGAMAHAIRDCLANLSDLHLSQARVQRLETHPGGVRLVLSDGTEILARQALLAAGVLGTSALLSRSLPQVTETRFDDHNPYMLKTVGLARALGASAKSADRHFNALTMRHLNDGRCDLFASVYRMSRAPVSLLTASLGLGTCLRGWSAGPLVDLVRPIQLWTPATVGHCRYCPQTNRVMSSPPQIMSDDNVLQSLLSWLRSKKVHTNTTTTATGQGFHHHGLKLVLQDGICTSVDSVLHSAFGDRVTCIDASVLPEVGCQPHTLTAMAQALARTRRVLAH